MSTAAISATGRRKNAVARVRLKAGSGLITVNERRFEDYFPSIDHQNGILAPLQTVEAAKKFDVDVNAHGGGPTGQVGAVRLGIARALCLADKDNRPKLKSAGFLTRDPRMKERKKSGRPGARKRFQFSKR